MRCARSSRSCWRRATSAARPSCCRGTTPWRPTSCSPGIKAYELGPESAEELIAGALGKEKARYEKRLNFLATLASNAPYVGLFGTVLGIVRSFRDLAANMADASSAVMAGIAESLIATAVGLLVAIPAVVAFNVFKARVKNSVTDGQMLARTLMSQLKAVEPAARQAAE